MDPEIFPSYCSVCDKQLSSSFDIYCSEQCKQCDSHICKSSLHLHSKARSPVSQPTYPSVLDYYMDELPPSPARNAPELSTSYSDDDMGDFLLPPSPKFYVADSALKRSALHTTGLTQVHA